MALHVNKNCLRLKKSDLLKKKSEKTKRKKIKPPKNKKNNSIKIRDKLITTILYKMV